MASRASSSSAVAPPSCVGLLDREEADRHVAQILLIVYIAYLLFQLKSHSFLFQAEHEDEEEEAEMSVTAAIGAYVLRLSPRERSLMMSHSLLLITVITAFCADYRASGSTSISILCFKASHSGRKH